MGLDPKLCDCGQPSTQLGLPGHPGGSPGSKTPGNNHTHTSKVTKHLSARNESGWPAGGTP